MAVEQELVVVLVVISAVVVVAVSVVVVVPLPVMGVWLDGQEVAVAVEKVPDAEVGEQVAGTLDAVGSPQE